jgi:hypothetical protein
MDSRAPLVPVALGLDPFVGMSSCFALTGK